MGDLGRGESISWENIVYIADFLQCSGENHVSLLGGEPTLHQDFVDIVLYLIERRFNVTVFSNGFMSRARLLEIKDCLTAVSPEQLTIVCNLNDPVQTPASTVEREGVHRFLSLMGPWTQPGFNIYRTDFTIGFLIEKINEYGMRRHLRIGLTHPLPGTNNSYIRPEDVGCVIDRLYSFRQLFDRFRVKAGLDCGFPVCKFTDEQLGWLFRLNGHTRFGFGCGPAIDVTPDMSVYSCFPLSAFHRRSLFEFDTIKDIQDYYRDLHTSIRSERAGIYDECDGCVYRNDGSCSGGGVCDLLPRFLNEPGIRLKDVEDGLSKVGLPV